MGCMQRQAAHELKASLGFIEILCKNKPKQKHPGQVVSDPMLFSGSH